MILCSKGSLYTGTPIKSLRFFRKDITLKAGGFDEDMVFYEEASLPHKIEKLDYYGRTTKAYISKYKGKYREYIRVQINPSQRFRMFILSKRFWSRPQLVIEDVLLKILEYLAVGLGYLISKVSL